MRAPLNPPQVQGQAGAAATLEGGREGSWKPGREGAVSENTGLRGWGSGRALGGGREPQILTQGRKEGGGDRGGGRREEGGA